MVYIRERSQYSIRNYIFASDGSLVIQPSTMAPPPVRPRAPRRRTTALLELADHMERRPPPIAEEKVEISSGERNEQRGRTIRHIKVAIEFISLVKEAIPQEQAKTVLSAMCTVLGSITTAADNNEDLETLQNRCVTIGQLFLHDMLGGRETDITNEAIQKLNKTVNDMIFSIRHKAQRHLCIQISSAKIDKEEIQGWNAKLNNDLVHFQTCAAVETGHMLRTIDKKVQTIIEQQVEVIRNPSRDIYQKDPPPSKPPIFYGRDDLILGVVRSLLKGEDVILLGPGGIGKSTIAKVVYHQDDIAAKFSKRRFFVRLEESDQRKVSFDSFMNRIVSALGLTASKANCQQSILTNLRSGDDTLLVLDSADTFVDSATDGKRIRDAIVEYQDIPSVVVLLTTRQQTLSYHPRWLTVPVPTLDPAAAYDLFTTIYPKDIPQDNVYPILTDLDYYPLSVHLLAQAAWQNDWSPEDLERSWKERQGHLLGIEGNNDGINTTIALSLSSPAIEAVNPSALEFLQVVAFFPSGVDRNKLHNIFPSVSNIGAIADLVQQHSLTQRSGDFITMLAPIRLYIAHNFNRENIPLLSDARDYYYSLLESSHVSGPDATDFDKGLWIRKEDDNVEQLILLDLSVPHMMERACDACITFVQHLIRYKRRPTCLEALVQGLPEDDPKKINFLGLNLPRPFGRLRTRVRKGVCMLSLGLLAAHTGRSPEAFKLFSEAKRLFDLIEDWNTSLFCLELMGQIHILRGQMVAAENLLKEGLRIARKVKDQREAEAQLTVSLGWVKILKDSHQAEKDFEKILSHFRQKGDEAWVAYTLNRLAYAQLYSKDNGAAKKSLEEECSIHAKRNDTWGCMGSNMALAEVALSVRNLPEADKYLDQARELALSVQDTQKASLALAVKSAIAADDKNYDLAREQIQEAIREVTFSEENENFRLVWCIYLAARNEFIARNYQDAKRLYLQTLEYSDPLDDVYTAVRSLKALGEIALLEGDVKAAKEYASKAQERSESTGVASYLQDIRYHCCLMKNSFEGRQLYQEQGLPRVAMI
ncbi:TPR-like protein [Dentipellis sp. KUC8613]|nr:TPR-like protein [Dentipellis sp. KUC8613]